VLKGQKDLTEFVVMSGNVAERIELVKEPLHFPAQFVPLSIINNCFAAIHLTRNDCFHAMMMEGLTHDVTVIGFIYDGRSKLRKSGQVAPKPVKAQRIVTLSIG